MVALMLTGVGVAIAGSVLLVGIRSYARQVDRYQVRANLRTAMAIFTRELRGIDAGDPYGSDIVEMERTSLTYRATRSTYFLCRPPDPSTSSITVWKDGGAVLRQLETGRDSVLLFAENDVADQADARWLSLGLGSVSSGAHCPGGAPSLRLTVRGASEDELAGVYRGAVVRGFQMTRILLYPDAAGLYWIGLRELRLDAGWSITQPILGPVARHGLTLKYLRADGSEADSPQSVARVVVEVVGVGYRRLAPGGDAMRDSLAIHIGLRNNPRLN